MADALKVALTKPTPVYPSVARQLHIEGKVDVEVRIGVDGLVTDIRILAGNAMFTQSILDTLKQWRFTPTVRDGAPVQALAVLSFTFKE
jgi:protein TonB